jgi:hypothetical protein
MVEAKCCINGDEPTPTKIAMVSGEAQLGLNNPEMQTTAR